MILMKTYRFGHTANHIMVFSFKDKLKISTYGIPFKHQVKNINIFHSGPHAANSGTLTMEKTKLVGNTQICKHLIQEIHK